MTLHAHTHQRAHKLAHTKLPLNALRFTVSAEILGIIENSALTLMTQEGRTKPVVIVFNETTTEDASSATENYRRWRGQRKLATRNLITFILLAQYRSRVNHENVSGKFNTGRKVYRGEKSRHIEPATVQTKIQ